MRPTKYFILNMLTLQVLRRRINGNEGISVYRKFTENIRKPVEPNP